MDIEGDNRVNDGRIKVKVRSTFAVGGTGIPSFETDSRRDFIVEMEAGATVESLLHKMPAIGSAEHWDDIMLVVFVNGTLRGHDHVLADNDEIDLHIPVSGG